MDRINGCGSQSAFFAQKRKSEKTDRKVEGLVLGMAAGSAAKYVSMLPCRTIRKITAKKNNLTSVKGAAQNMLEANGLKGTKVRLIANTSLGNTKQIIYHYKNSSPIFWNAYKMVRKVYSKLPSKAQHAVDRYMAKRLSAPKYFEGLKQIQANRDHAFEVFQEAGKAINSLSKTGKAMKVLRMLTPFAAGVLGAVAIFSKNIPTPGKEDQSLSQNIKNNIGLLVLGSFMPTFIDEAVASVRAFKFVRGYDTKMLSGLKAATSVKFITVISSAIAAATAAKVAVVIKDNMAKEE